MDDYKDTNGGYNNKYGKSYGKRPLWQWILLYVIIGVIAYGAVYYFYFYKSGSGNSNQNTTPYNSSGY